MKRLDSILKGSTLEIASIGEVMEFRQRENPVKDLFYVLRDKGEIVATVQLIPESFGYTITGIRTAKKHQRKGLMGEILKGIIEKKYPNDTFMLEVEASNRKAIELYKKLGFKFTGEVVHVFDGEEYKAMKLSRT